MKLILSMFCSLVLAGGVLLAADSKDAAKKPTTQPTTQPAKAFNKFCAVEQENKIDPKGGTYVYKDKVIGFCCPDCIDEFKKDPEKYMKTIK